MTRKNNHNEPKVSGSALEIGGCNREEAELIVLNTTGLARATIEKKANFYAAGNSIYRQGHPSLGVYYILNGTIGIRQSDRMGNSTLLRLIEAGQTIGHEAYFATESHTNTATALTDCQIFFVERCVMDEIRSGSPALAEQFLQRMAKDLEQSNISRVEGIHLQVRARLAQLLLTLRQHHGTVDDEGNLHLQLPMSRRDIASAIGTRPESLSRAIRALEQSGVALFKGKQVLVRDLDDLLDEVEGR
jgi:CRP/FNR family transcriptional regulator, anaerobic regulatory protein